MPDLMCLNNHLSTIIVTECKSLMTENTKSILYIPQDQVVRCISFIEIFQRYRTRDVVFSFKFGRGYRKSYYFTLSSDYYHLDILYARCSYDGKCGIVIQSSPGVKQLLPLNPRQNLIAK